jgi:hypothetical protein
VDNLRKLVEEYRGQPEAERKPVLEKDLGKPNPDQMPPAPPPGGLALIVYNTPLEQTADGKLSRAQNLTAPGPSWTLETPITLNDLHWLTRAEWQSLVPLNPKKGQTGRVAQGIQNRLFRLSGYDWTGSYQNDAPALRSGDLSWTVDEVTDKMLSMRLEGFSKVGGSRDDVQKCSCKSVHACNHWGSDLNYLGFMKIDRAQKAIVELRMVALGETHTRYDRKTMKYDNEVRAVPTGLVIELASDCPANRGGWHPLEPYRMRHVPFNYWDVGKQ